MTRACWSLLLAGLVTACQPGGRAVPASDRCEFVVYNRTTYAVDVRVIRHQDATMSLGMLNPGEAFTQRLPCSSGNTWLRAFAQPPYIGAPMPFAYVDAYVELTPGLKTSVSLQRP